MPSRWPDADFAFCPFRISRTSPKSLIALLTLCVRLGIPSGTAYAVPSSVLSEVGCNAVDLSIPLAGPPPSPPARGEGLGTLLPAPGDGGGTSGVLGRSDGLSVEFLAIRAKKSSSHHIRSSRRRRTGRPTREEDSHNQSLGVKSTRRECLAVTRPSQCLTRRSSWVGGVMHSKPFFSTKKRTHDSETTSYGMAGL